MSAIAGAPGTICGDALPSAVAQAGNRGARTRSIPAFRLPRPFDCALIGDMVDQATGWIEEHAAG
jgi:hypothetical protein